MGHTHVTIKVRRGILFIHGNVYHNYYGSEPLFVLVPCLKIQISALNSLVLEQKILALDYLSSFEDKSQTKAKLFLHQLFQLFDFEAELLNKNARVTNFLRVLVSLQRQYFISLNACNSSYILNKKTLNMR